MWRGGLGDADPLTGAFVCRCLTAAAMLRFHTPLIEPDVRISRIRLSEKEFMRSPTGATRPADVADMAAPAARRSLRFGTRPVLRLLNLRWRC